jgi:hypothetical protein
MYLRQLTDAAADGPPLGGPTYNAMLARPLLPQYRLASGWAEVAHEWGTADLWEAHLICDAIDDANERARSK